MNRNNLEKIEISKNLSSKLGLPVSYSRKLINDLIIILSKSIKKNNLILKNIGTFKIINKSERVGRNPKTRKSFKISKRKSISFIASKRLLNSLNE